MRTGYLALKRIAGQLPPQFEPALDIAYATGRRSGAILGLRWQDVNFEISDEAPNGSIRWYAGKKSDTRRSST